MIHEAMEAGSDPSTHDETERLGEEIAALAAHLHAATYKLLSLLRAFDAREGWGLGFQSCAHWLSWRTGIALGPAREKVRVARALGALPLISKAMERGQLSYSKVRALTRVATPDNEQDLMEFALHGTASHVERLVRAWRRIDGLEAEQVRHESRHLSLYPDEDGSYVVRGRLDPEVGALLHKALETASEQLYGRTPAREGVPPPAAASPADVAPSAASSAAVPPSASVPPSATAAQRRADALGLVAEQALAGAVVEQRAPVSVPAGTSTGSRRADRFQVVLHVDAEAMVAGSATGHAVVADSAQRVPAETARRIGCDAAVVEVGRGKPGDVLDVGRKRRTVPPAIRRALEARDVTCRFPGCQNRHCDAHHVRHWADGGATKLDNLVLLCRRHHRAVHEDGFGLEAGEHGSLRFIWPNGRPMEDAPTLPSLRADTAARRVRKLGGVGDERLGGDERVEAAPLIPTWCGERFDLDWSILVLRRRQRQEGRDTRPAGRRDRAAS